MDAVVLAGGRLTGGFARKTGVTVKALLRWNGKSLLSILESSLRKSGLIRNVFVVGSHELESVCADGRMTFIPEGKSASDNLIRSVTAIGGRGRALVCAADLPFVQPEDIGQVIARTPSDAALSYCAIQKEEYRQVFPNSSGRYIRFADGLFCGGGLAVLDCAAVLRLHETFARAFAARKNRFALARLLKLPFLAHFSIGQIVPALAPPLEDLRACVEEICGCPCVVVRGCSPRIAFDIDGLADWNYLLKEFFLDERERTL